MAKPSLLATIICDRIHNLEDCPDLDSPVFIQLILDMAKTIVGERTSWVRGFDDETDPKERYRNPAPKSVKDTAFFKYNGG